MLCIIKLTGHCCDNLAARPKDGTVDKDGMVIHKEVVYMAKGSSKRGFAAMSKEKRRRIASMGGRSSHGGGRRSGQVEK